MLIEGVTMRRGRVLIVDDDEGTRSLVRQRLRHLDHEVFEAADGVSAASLLEAHDVDVVLCDYMMPGLTGVELFSRLRTTGRDVEFVLMTAHANLPSVIEIFEDGSCDYLVKPFHLWQLDRTVERALALREARRELALYRATDAIFGELDAATLPSRVVEVAVEVMGADDASLMLLEDGELHVRYSHQRSAKVHQAKVPLGQRVAGRVAAERKPLIVNSPPEGAASSDSGQGGRVRSAIVYPLVLRNELLGVLNINRIDNRCTYNASDLDRAGILAGMVSLAVGNERLLSAQRDQITRLETMQTHLMHIERMASVGLLAAGIVHEINNPMAAVLGNAQYLTSELEAARADGSALHEEHVGAARDICEAAQRIRAIAVDMRRLARGESGDMAPSDVNDAVRAAARLAGAEVRGRATLELSLTPDLLVCGHAGPLTQVFLNLIVNAAQAIAARKAKDDGGVDAHAISIHSRREGGEAVVEVKDSGTGIAPEVVQRIFEPLFTTKPVGQGTGLGLSLSRDIVTKHGGRIEVQSTVGVGTIFRVCLPSADAPAARLPRDRVLVVDDDPRQLEALRRVLASDYDIVCARSGEEALLALDRDRTFVAVLTDVMIPDLSGLEVFAAARTRWPDLQDRFIFMSGTLNRQELELSLAAAGQDFIEKPVNLERLQRALRAKSSSNVSSRSPLRGRQEHA